MGLEGLVSKHARAPRAFEEGEPMPFSEIERYIDATELGDADAGHF
jgi:hypothetical protein